jgi:hypothetical protein
MSTELRAFCNQLVAFFEDLSETYPEETDIATAAQALALMKQANPRYIYRIFMQSVYTEFAEHILNEDEDYILGRAKQMLASDYANINFAFWIFDKHWSTMSETNKQYVWKYIKSLILLAKRVPA